jgi:3-deoxy-D-arabino-heptulosonate 7-phosphate (DAHP) synthase
LVSILVGSPFFLYDLIKVKKMSKNIVIVAGPCAVESEEQVFEMGYKIKNIRDIVKPYGIDIYFRGGAWKPRTEYLEKNNSIKKKIFEGMGEIGLQWLSKVAKEYNLPIVSEDMSEMDIRHFFRYLEPERDYIQIGARTSQAFALLYEVGGTPFGVVLKNATHGIDSKEVQGSLERFLKNRQKVFCIRGQKKFIHPDGKDSPEHIAYMEKLLNESNQSKDSRNLNNIETINVLRDIDYFKENKILFCYDPSHIWGGKTHEMRGRIGEYAIKAVKEYGYDWIMIEVNDKSATAKCDREQALFTTVNGIDWSQTFVGEEPPEDKKPLTLVDIVRELINIQISRGKVKIDKKIKEVDGDKLNSIRWDMSP